MVPRIQGLPMSTTMDTFQDLEQQEGLCGRPGAVQGETSVLFAAPTLILFPGSSSGFQDSSTKPPPTLTQKHFSRRELRDAPIRLLGAELLSFTIGLGTFNALHVLTDILVGER